MISLRIVFGDQLSHTLTSLVDCDPQNDVILMCEVLEETQTVNHHRKKLIFLFSAMRHFATELKTRGFKVRYVSIDDPENTGSFDGEVVRAIDMLKPDRVVVTHPGEYRILEKIKKWGTSFSGEIDLRDDDRFLCSAVEFENWAKGRKVLRMEHFYQSMRKEHAILLDGHGPEGGKWNYDVANRRQIPPDKIVPKRFRVQPNDVTNEVIELVRTRFKDHFGDVTDFEFAVTRNGALEVLDDFIQYRLPEFGDYQDAMREGDPWLFHSHISLYLNTGLLLPGECIKRAEQAYREGNVPLNAAEGFIRQILGWREYVRGVYWMFMPDYGGKNFFNTRRPLPAFYWSGQTRMNCLRQCVLDTKHNAYAHHIQRLMVLGNFALIAGIDPDQVNAWFLAVYADAFEWVELPNVTGMALFADGGMLASKPYASGGNYISKMSDYCKGCSYKISRKNGDKACPFNYLYWDFLARNRLSLEDNRRLSMIYKTYDRMSGERKAAIKEDSARFLKELK